MAPKNSKSGKKDTLTAPVKPQAINVDKNGDLAIKILAKPGSKTSEVTGITEEGELSWLKMRH